MGPEWQNAGVAAGWSTWQQDAGVGVFSLDASEKHSGQRSGAFKGGTCLCYITQVPITTGQTYLAEVWARSPVVRAGTQVTLEVRWQDAQSRWYNGAANHLVETRHANTWERLLIPFTAPPGAAKAVILMVGYGIQPDDLVRFDDAFCGTATRP